MSADRRGDLSLRLEALENGGPERISALVDLLLNEAVRRSASDVHFEPTHRNLEVRYRIDGVLQRVGSVRKELAPNLVARLKVLADLLTYRLDIPQEGRVPWNQYGVDLRVSTFPTIHGEKAAVRIFEAAGETLDLEQLGLPADILKEWMALMQQRTGVLFLTGPSGSGKTTTIYACLRHLVQASGGSRNIVTIEDPVEQVLEGVSQSQARPGTEFDFARGLRSLLRQDPEVILIGEVRDPDTAGIAIEAALTGHLVFSTLHAGSACGVIGRLLEMGIETYLLTSGLKGILNQRLVRRLCSDCRRETAQGWEAVGCEKCLSTGYHGRFLLTELLVLDAPLRRAILSRADTGELETLAHQSGRPTLWTQADQVVKQGWTTIAEIERVLGPRS
jgi:general secretion pathway protein E